MLLIVSSKLLVDCAVFDGAIVAFVSVVLTGEAVAVVIETNVVVSVVSAGVVVVG